MAKRRRRESKFACMVLTDEEGLLFYSCPVHLCTCAALAAAEPLPDPPVLELLVTLTNT